VTPTSENAKALSAEYYRRRSQLVRARWLLATLIPFSIGLLVVFSLAEGWVVRWLLSSNLGLGGLAATFIAIVAFLAIYCVGMARVTLHMVYHIEHAGVARTAVIGAFLVAYVFVFTKLPSPQTVFPLAAGKLFSIFLFFRFWQSQLAETRLRARTLTSPRVFIVSFRAFLVSVWVVIACFLLCALGFALALASMHPVIDLDGWEGLMLLATFYFLFRIFVRNPNAHALPSFIFPRWRRSKPFNPWRATHPKEADFSQMAA
jgi:hypothetical protein